jgi:hypothetical protein
MRYQETRAPYQRRRNAQPQREKKKEILQCIAGMIFKAARPVKAQFRSDAAAIVSPLRGNANALHSRLGRPSTVALRDR